VALAKRFSELSAKVSASDNGKPTFLSDWEKSAVAGRDVDAPTPWNEPFVKEWRRSALKNYFN
jgi:hypothetical protein